MKLYRYSRPVTRIAGITLAGTLIFAEGASAVSAAEVPTEKEEVIYCILKNDGSVNGVYAVNSFKGGDITDYGNYTSVKNLTTTDSIKQERDKITLHTDAEKVYYQGNMDTKEIPWNIAITYKMDGKEYSAEEIAGMSGELEMHISITQNTYCDDSFFNGYALQASLTLDGNKCTNIEAEDATIVNIGANKQLSYIILPGNGKEIEITADVKDFEMDAISINAMKLNMNLEMDTEELTEKVEDIQDAIRELDDGAKELDDGAAELSDGAKELDDGAKDLSDGAKRLYDGTVTLDSGAQTLDEGVASLNKGIKTMQEALKTLDKKSSTLKKGSSEVLKALQQMQTALSGVSMDAQQLTALSTASTQIKGGIDSLVTGLQTMDAGITNYQNTLAAAGITDVHQFAEQNNQAAASLGVTETQRAIYQAYMQGGDAAATARLQELAGSGNAEAEAVLQQYQAMGDATVISNYISNAVKLTTIENLLKADASYIQGSNTLISGMDTNLDANSGALMQGALSLQTNYAAFDTNIQSMVKTLSSLSSNLKDLKEGIDTLTTNYKELDKGITEYTGAVGKMNKSYQDIYKGSLSIASGTSQLYKGTTDLVSGSLELYNGSKDLKDGTTELYDGTVKLKDGTVELTDGTAEFKSETADMDTEIEDTIKDKVDEMTGKDIETISFVSEKNTDVDSVLFVMKTSAIEAEEAEEPVEETEEKVSIKDKFLRLFKKNKETKGDE